MCIYVVPAGHEQTFATTTYTKSFQFLIPNSFRSTRRLNLFFRLPRRQSRRPSWHKNGQRSSVCTTGSKYYAFFVVFCEREEGKECFCYTSTNQHLQLSEPISILRELVVVHDRARRMAMLYYICAHVHTRTHTHTYTYVTTIN